MIVSLNNSAAVAVVVRCSINSQIDDKNLMNNRNELVTEREEVLIKTRRGIGAV